MRISYSTTSEIICSYCGKNETITSDKELSYNEALDKFEKNGWRTCYHGMATDENEPNKLQEVPTVICADCIVKMIPGKYVSLTPRATDFYYYLNDDGTYKRRFAREKGENITDWALRVEALSAGANECSMPYEFAISDIVGACDECGAPVNKDGECEIGCEYGEYGCQKCHIRCCDLSC